CVHAPDPLHAPVFPHGGFTAHALDVVPDGTLKQVPRWPLTLQAWQGEQLAEPQHTPFVQNPDVHSLLDAPVAPWAFFGWQVPPAPVQKKLVLTQSAFVEQVVLQDVVDPQTYGLQLCVAGDLHDPAPLHVVASVSVDPVHDCDPHDTVLAACVHAPVPLQT